MGAPHQQQHEEQQEKEKVVVKVSEEASPSSSGGRSSVTSKSVVEGTCCFSKLRGVQWRRNLGILPSDSSRIHHLRRAAADSRRRYALLRRQLLIDPYISKKGHEAPALVMDDPLSQKPDSMWGVFFRNAELEKMLDQDLSRLYPEHGSYFQTPDCQAMLRRILLLWCLQHPETGYKQGMHELLAPLLYVLHCDAQTLLKVRKLHGDHFNDKLDGLSFPGSNKEWGMKLIGDRSHSVLENGDIDSCRSVGKLSSLDELKPDIRTVILIGDPYGAEGELGILLSERFLEHDAYSMFDALMSRSGGLVAMADYFSTSPSMGTNSGLVPVIEACSSLYRVLSVVDPSLHFHLVDLGVEPQYFGLRWLRVLFGREFLLKDLLIIWDAIFESPNSPTTSALDDKLRTEIRTSSRGAFITAFAVTMLLNLRSSILATENATSCLQRLLNFPQNVDVRKLIEKAKALHSLALNPIIIVPPAPVPLDRSRSSMGRNHRFASPVRTSCSHSPGVLMGPMPDSYWEEKWRSSVMHKPELLDDSSKKPLFGKGSNGLDRGSMGSSRFSSDTSSIASKEKKDAETTVRRRLLDDLTNNIGSNVHQEEGSAGTPPIGSSGIEVDMQKDSVKEIQEDNRKNVVCMSEETGLRGSTLVPEEEIEKVKEVDNAALSSKIEPSSKSDHQAHVDPVRESNSNTSTDLDAQVASKRFLEKQLSVKDRRSLSGRFSWFFRFGRNGGEGASDKASEVEPKPVLQEDTDKKLNDEMARNDVHPRDPSPIVNGEEANKKGSLRSLGRSMLENIQVLELAFQTDKGSHNAPKGTIRVKKQHAALAALKELRKISNLLSDM